MKTTEMIKNDLVRVLAEAILTGDSSDTIDGIAIIILNIIDGVYEEEK